MSSTSLRRIGSSVLFWALPLAAHDLYLMPATFRPTERSVVIAAHNGDSFPASEDAPRPERLKNAFLYGWKGKLPIAGWKQSGKQTVATAQTPGTGSIVAGLETEPNFIALDSDKFTAYLKEEGLTEAIAWRDTHGQANTAGRERYRKSAKAILRVGAADGYETQPLGHVLEFVPLRSMAEDFRVKVLFRGKAASGLEVELTSADGKTRKLGRTDENGVIGVEAGAAGTFRLHTIRMERCADAKAADWESYWASLTFQVD